MTMRVRNSILVIVAAILFASVSCFFLSRSADSYDQQLASQQVDIDSLKTRISVAKATQEGNAAAAVVAVSGLDMERKAADDEIITEFASRVTTWNGYDEYTRMRNEIMNEYHFSSTDMFMQNFLPSRPQGYDETVGDSSVGCRFDHLKSICYTFDEDTGVYSYFAEVVCIANGSAGGNTTVTSFFLYTVDSDGNIGNLTAYNK